MWLKKLVESDLSTLSSMFPGCVDGNSFIQLIHPVTSYPVLFYHVIYFSLSKTK